MTDPRYIDSKAILNPKFHTVLPQHYMILSRAKNKSEEDQYVASVQTDESLCYHKGIAPFSDRGSFSATLVSVVVCGFFGGGRVR